MNPKEYLKELKIEFKEFKHPEVFTCEEAEKYNKDIKGIHSKNLFIKNRKATNYYLVIIPSKEKLDLKKIGSLLNEKLTFASEEELKNILGLTAGAVSPFALINDKENKVTLIIDKKVLDSEYVSFHPNTNTETLELSTKNFKRYIETLKKQMRIL